MAPIADKNKSSPIHDLETHAHKLAARMPSLLVAAQRVSHTVAHGIHGRRRRGPGETFWQFRHFENSDSADGIDWRRSASSDHLYVREREWEAAHTCWMWADQSISMGFQSHLSKTSKIDRAIVLALAMGELLVRGGERIGLLGGRPRTGRMATNEMALGLARRAANADRPDASLPPKVALGAFSECILFSDFLEPVDELAQRLEQIAVQGVRGHLVQILDPAEESLPYSGRTEFTAPESGDRMIAGRAESLRDAFQARMTAHRQELSEVLRRLEWSMLVHHTDRPAEEPLLAIHGRLAGLERDYRYRAPAESLDVDPATSGAAS